MTLGSLQHVNIIKQNERRGNCRKLPICINAARITKKERRRLVQSMLGYTQQQQADEDCRTLTTITKQSASVVKKLGAANITHAVAIAISAGIISA
jgi:DNA-binding CsgD family transcriptional regulator